MPNWPKWIEFQCMDVIACNWYFYTGFNCGYTQSIRETCQQFCHSGIIDLRYDWVNNISMETSIHEIGALYAGGSTISYFVNLQWLARFINRF